MFGSKAGQLRHNLLPSLYTLANIGRRGYIARRVSHQRSGNFYIDAAKIHEILRDFDVIGRLIATHETVKKNRDDQKVTTRTGYKVFPPNKNRLDRRDRAWNSCFSHNLAGLWSLACPYTNTAKTRSARRGPPCLRARFFEMVMIRTRRRKSSGEPSSRGRWKSGFADL